MTPTVTLNNGVCIPQLGFGVWQVPDDQAERSVAVALQTGYRSIDTAKLYFNEEGVARAVRHSAVPREDIFLTTKLWNDDHDYDAALRAFDASLQRLGVEVVDLYLIHWPVPEQDKYRDAWRALATIYAEGRARAIGVSNFTVENLRRLLDGARVVPAINQIELHPQLAQRELRAVHAEYGIATEAWSPLGSGKGLLQLPALVELAGKYAKTPAQVVLRWHLQHGIIAIPKSVTPSRIAENFDVFGWQLDEQDMTAIDGWDIGRRLGPDPATFNWLG